jgi:hypothetical protein
MTASTEPSTVDRLSPQRLPDFFIVGHQKCGTTALYRMLRRHPQVFMAGIKEPRYLASDLRDRFRIPATATNPETLEDYLALFSDARPDQLAGEASPNYLTSRTAANEIAELQPDARIIAILREPASFLRSLHLQFLQTHVETEKDMRKALALEQLRREGKRIPSRSHRPSVLLYSEHVRYVEQLRRYHAVFPAGQILVLIYDDFRRDNEATVRRVLRFLQVDETVPVAPRDANPTVRLRSPRLHQLVHSVASGESPVARAVQASAKALAPRRLTRETAVAIRGRLLYTTPAPPDERLMLELRRRYKNEVVALSEYLERDLVSAWGYRDID